MEDGASSNCKSPPFLFTRGFSGDMVKAKAFSALWSWSPLYSANWQTFPWIIFLSFLLLLVSISRKPLYSEEGPRFGEMTWTAQPNLQGKRLPSQRVLFLLLTSSWVHVTMWHKRLGISPRPKCQLLLMCLV